MQRYYAGIGSRETPKDICSLMTKISSKLESCNYILRSGGAKGADKAFESGVRNVSNKEIYLTKNTTTQAMELASKFHPNWNACSTYAKLLHGRNCFQVLGPHLDSIPSEWSSFLLILAVPTSDGVKGGTGQAVRIANHFKILVYNLFDEFIRKRIEEFVK